MKIQTFTLRKNEATKFLCCHGNKLGYSLDFFNINAWISECTFIMFQNIILISITKRMANSMGENPIN